MLASAIVSKPVYPKQLLNRCHFRTCHGQCAPHNFCIGLVRNPTYRRQYAPKISELAMVPLGSLVLRQLQRLLAHETRVCPKQIPNNFAISVWFSVLRANSDTSHWPVVSGTVGEKKLVKFRNFGVVLIKLLGCPFRLYHTKYPKIPSRFHKIHIVIHCYHDFSTCSPCFHIFSEIFHIFLDMSL